MVNIGFSITITNSLGNRDHSSFVCQATNSKDDTSDYAESKNDRTNNPRNGGYLETKGNKPNDCHRSNSSNGTQVREVNRTSSDFEIGRPIPPCKIFNKSDIFRC